MAQTTPLCDFGWQAPAFELPATDGSIWTLEQIRGQKGTLIMFLSNHCPYVMAIAPKLVREAAAARELGLGVAAICSNDAEASPEDSFENMQEYALRLGYDFPYLHDADQSVARAYGAVCTPDFFVFDAGLGLQYRGRLDASGRAPSPDTTERELYDAMRQISRSGRGPAEQIASIGCSIKWKPD